MPHRFIKVRCRTCESEVCKKRPLGSWVTDEEGCLKEVDALTADKYYHYIAEVKPVLKTLAFKEKKISVMWDEMLTFIHHVHNLPAGERFK